MIFGLYSPRYLLKGKLHHILSDYYDEFRKVYDKRYREKYGPLRKVVENTVQKILHCANPNDGFAHLRYRGCGREYIVPFSCKERVCPSCGQKRLLIWCEWLFEKVLFRLRHRHWCFTIPVVLRPIFRKNRKLLGDLCSLAADTLTYYMRQLSGQPEASPGIVATIQTAGERLNWNPHIHLIATVGVLAPDYRYYLVPKIPYDVMRLTWRDRVLGMLFSQGFISEKYVAKLKKRYPKGFMLNGKIRDDWDSNKVISRLAEYIIRAPIGENRILDYNKEKGEVTIQHRKRDASGSKTKKMDKETINVLDFIARLCQHSPDACQQTVRYYGIYSNKNRGMRKTQKVPEFMLVEDDEPSYGRTWRQLIWKIYEVDPMKCPECGGELALVNIVTDKKEITVILSRMESQREQLERTHAPP